MSDSWELLRQLVQDVNQQAEQAKELHRKARDLTGSSRSQDGMVTVTVGPQGELRSVEFDPRVYRELSPSELAACVVEQAALATRQVSDELRSLAGPLIADDVPFEDLFGEGVSFESFLPGTDRRKPGT
ncbi:YbaB/EbfC family nucleoid-associated protein [Nonomuraea rhodomycinica]|uniref:YbaB/EbfC family nucleoid-associated protein n=1 Tax=Nonomuraea rhodomycinica TaxID=1712872 RepID=A0A7Y6MGL4_9ACTN|nr:YbaB/EbfC family nucleoid-associated protein [Nonomuraea rhodomycinica]NUW45826.1 YbaB/EbfC family nucleoid-associated protein [Nonomuraea rhodomycinica]